MTIKVNDTIYDVVALYKKANTSAQRALAGYIIKSGQTNDPILGGAFDLLRQVERCTARDEIYQIYPCADKATHKKIMYAAQLALDGKLDKFMISDRERNEIVKNLCETF